MAFILFILGFYLLIRGADYLVDGASALARRFKVSDLFIGLSIVAFGTSCPELFVNISASFKGASEIAVGNIVGSNITNVFLILGLAAIVFPLRVTRGTVLKEIPFNLFITLLLWALISNPLLNKPELNILSRTDGYILLIFFIFFFIYLLKIARKKEGFEEGIPHLKLTLFNSIFFLLIGLAFLVLGSNLVVENAIIFAKILKVDEKLIGLTIVALGTSLPELATSVVAAYKKNAAIAVGNIIGSNIFNILFIFGISALIRPLSFYSGSNIDIFIMILAQALIFIFMFTGKKHKIDKWEGIILFILYFVYLFFIRLR
ncbi:MAG: calcium/sodium antiporter [Candidatus Margulisbacteria bacterium]|nr:calcium/sodium antiporter [Candidatus Margulisiibacteriota bacterium]